MNALFIDDQTFAASDLEGKTLQKADYDGCEFDGCDFSNQDLSQFSFVDCIFNNCNLSNVTVINSTFRDAEFKECKMLGVDFNRCHEYGLSASFVDCQLSHSIFFKRILKKTVFRNCQIVEADFTECDLSESVFDECDLSGSTFDRTKLLKADLRTAHNYNIDPENNMLKGAHFSLSGLPGLLGKYGLKID